jgi:hypothetical protein
MSERGKAERKYLESYAEPEARFSRHLAGATLGNALVIPAYGEARGLQRVLASLPAPPRGALLTIVVINARADSPPEVHASNEKTCAQLLARQGPGAEVEPGIWRLEHERGPLVLIERASEGRFLPARQGVGLARKIGADLALAVAAEHGLRSDWIHCTDADARLPASYFECAPTDGECVALTYPFRHVHFDGDRDEAPSDVALEYEISLRYHVLGLRYATSPYAFHTIGSTIAFRPGAYARVRGFPRRMAAEDFHLLAKLRKLGPVITPRAEPVLLSDRESTRVPFGTGAAVLRENARRQQGLGMLLYHPLTFENLRIWLAALSAAAADPDLDLLQEIEGGAQRSPGVDGGTLQALLEQSGQIARARRGLREGRDLAQRSRRLHEGFDALATLKLIHALRDRGAPSLALREALELAPFADSSGVEDLEVVRSALERAEGQREAPSR